MKYLTRRILSTAVLIGLFQPGVRYHIQHGVKPTFKVVMPVMFFVFVILILALIG
jgi:hypothetical protein